MSIIYMGTYCRSLNRRSCAAAMRSGRNQLFLGRELRPRRRILGRWLRATDADPAEEGKCRTGWKTAVRYTGACPAARSLARSTYASTSRHATDRTSGRQPMRANRRPSNTCRHACRRKEPLRSDQSPGHADGAVPWRVFELAGTISGTICARAVCRNSKPVVYLGFSPR